ncbi:protein mono-ADP-ribosyltransferase PARP12-like [Littorina saxatilis]|uniref:protein mono-ADP-ribosyltransferase PARP12-like n=1 Tax=Littorina saxatilis TaxID=31220 RepID=UPI0038B51006
MADTHPSRKLVKNAMKVLLASARCDCRESVVNIFCKLKERRADAFKAADTDVLETWLRKCPELFIVFEESGQVYVRPTAALGFCPGHISKRNPCQQKLCNHLHACPRFFLTGACGFRDRCSYGHNLRTPLNCRLLKLHGVGVLDLTELRTLLRLPWVRRGVSMPRMCWSYNSCGGCVREGGRCHGLHLCSRHVLGFSGGECERNHDVMSQDVAQTLALYGISAAGRRPENVVKEVQAYVTYRNDTFVYTDCDVRDIKRKNKRADIETGATAKPQKTDSISTKSVGGKCRFGESCYKLHSDRPFLWMMGELPGGKRTRLENDQDLTWSSFDHVNNVLLEKYFSQPDIAVCCLENVDGAKMRVDFNKRLAECIATDKVYRIRRLGTPSRAELNSDQWRI